MSDRNGPHQIEQAQAPGVALGRRRVAPSDGSRTARGSPCPDGRNDTSERQRVDQRDVQHVEEERHPAEDGEPAARASPRARSSSGISAIVGPSVISRKLSEAGYFVVLRNESRAGIRPPGRPRARVAVQVEAAQHQEQRDAAQPDRVADPVPPRRLERQDLPKA